MRDRIGSLPSDVRPMRQPCAPMYDQRGRLTTDPGADEASIDQLSLHLAVPHPPKPAPSGPLSPPEGQVPSDGAANVALVQEQDARPPKFDLPTRRSFSPTPLGHGAPIFQFDAQRLRDDISVPTLVGVVASAKGAPLGNREFDVLTMLTRWYLEKPEKAARKARRAALAAGSTVGEADTGAEVARRDATEDRFVEATMYQLAMAIYGAVSRERYAALGRAIDNLKAVTVTLPGFDVQTGSYDSHSLSKVNLVSSIVITDQQRQLQFARDNGDENLARIFGSAKGKVTLKVELDQWICTAVQERYGNDLNFDVQRELAGQAKSLWVQLEALAFEPADDGEETERYQLAMDEATFNGLGLHCQRPSDNVKKVRQRLDSILDKDPSYLSYDVMRDARDRRRVSAIVVTRTTGAMRQQRLRDHERQKLLEVAAA
jgi:hypothetical protein